MSSNPNELIEPVLEIAREAGRQILEIYGRDFDVESKADDSPLTEADMASHRAIVAGLTKLTPEIPLLSEESAEIPFEERRSWNEYWLIDPLDGTKEFIKRNGEFTVNIALIRDGKPVLGVVHVPVKDTDYYGAEGLGAFRKIGAAAPAPIKATSETGSPVRVVGSRSHRGESLDAYLERLGAHEMVPMGSSLKLCLVAAGDADVYPRLGLTCEWDTAAAQGVVEAAGGRVVDLDGKTLRYNTKDEYLNPFFIVFGDGSRDWTAYLSDSGS
ncbi:MAG: 3'(2'),5'-bisphosphate nucleotidase CysQ [Chromatiales bacterium]|jgi:3'(2'), 5'-bisphosphate nucleotidase|nr:3'(2'),5'-bisphosphate nucleotidase CysQ [Chromatiales bacterium]MDH4029587.1 3'(2'),5'-bisphosphate nucleotidase CysQ [Chromatiales bacterium]